MLVVMTPSATPDEIERVHDMRVATRRLRAALEVFEPCFERKRFNRVLSEVKALADALGERRDPDVTIATLVEFVGDVGEADRPGHERPRAFEPSRSG